MPTNNCFQCKYFNNGYCYANPPGLPIRNQNRKDIGNPSYDIYPQVEATGGPCHYFKKKGRR